MAATDLPLDRFHKRKLACLAPLSLALELITDDRLFHKDVEVLTKLAHIADFSEPKQLLDIQQTIAPAPAHQFNIEAFTARTACRSRRR
jgi:hypothetical protein